MGGINGAIFDFLNDDLAGRSALLDHLMKFSSQYAIYVILGLLAVSWFVRVGRGEQRRTAVYTGVLSAAIAIGIAIVIQHFYVHDRPFVDRGDVVLLVHHSPDASFPSEHSTAAFGMAAGAGLYRQRLGLLMLALAILTAFSRVYVGIHYPSDVAGGAAIGIGAALLVWTARPLLVWIDGTVVRRVVPSFLL
ncbi:MAG TPA: phosphatase PAP2 family protein [Dehalococcoidia bacterium]|nr:phosphatase PAP2 family protein [Dehalococcoidia bacterium]